MVTFEEVHDICMQWNSLYKNIEEFKNKESIYYNDWIYGINNILKKYRDTYLEENKSELFISYCLKYLYGRLKFEGWRKSKIDENVLKQWEKVFHDAVISKKDNQFCDDPEILTLHKDKYCESYDWGCWLCDDVQNAWEKKLNIINECLILDENHTKPKSEMKEVIDLMKEIRDLLKKFVENVVVE